jgi:hypothetical protein
MTTTSPANRTLFHRQRDQIELNLAFQAACQDYAHHGGSSGRIASAAVRALGTPFENAVALDPEGLIAVIELARRIWEGEELAEWLTTPQSRFEGCKSPLEMCGVIGSDPDGSGADDVMDVLEQIELP